MVLGWPVAVIALAIVARVLFVRGRPRKATSLVMAVLVATLLWKQICWTADCVHVVLTTQFDLGQIGSSPPRGDDGFAAYDWSVGLIGLDTFLIRDPTDEIALPLAKHKHPVASEDGFGEQCAGNVEHRFGHYYKCFF